MYLIYGTIFIFGVIIIINRRFIIDVYKYYKIKNNLEKPIKNINPNYNKL
jgi:hypothetical protein